MPGCPCCRESRSDRGADEAAALAEQIGYPVIVKAVAGGGREEGMRVVWDPADFVAAWNETRASAHAIFRDGRLYVERYLDSARHVEIQILADKHGGIVQPRCRDCSCSAGTEKLVEESPAPLVSDERSRRWAPPRWRGGGAVGLRGGGNI